MFDEQLRLRRRTVTNRSETKRISCPEKKNILFNFRNAGKPIEARKELDELLPAHLSSKHAIFREFGALLEKYGR